jgi:ATP phosphoribosyltransferase
MSRYVEDGTLDAGLTGKDWIMENGSDVTEVSELIYGKQGLRPVRWVLAVPNDSEIKSVADLEGKKIATELVGFTNKYLAERNIKADVEFSWGATEVKAPKLVDAIIEVTETGSSLKANNLRIVETLLESTTRFVANNDSYADEWKKKKIDNIALMIRGALEAEEKVGLKMNVEKKDLKAVLDILPALQKPTVNELSVEGWYDVDTIIDESIARDLIPQLKDIGAEGIVEYPLNKIIY